MPDCTIWCTLAPLLDLLLPIATVAAAQQARVELAGGTVWELFLEIDRTDLVVAQVSFDRRDPDARPQGPAFCLTEFRVGRAEHRGNELAFRHVR